MKPTILSKFFLLFFVLILVAVTFAFVLRSGGKNETKSSLSSKSTPSDTEFDKTEDLESLARKFAQSDPLAGIRYAEGLSEAERFQFLDIFFASWAAHDPEGAFGFLASTWEQGFDTNRELPYESYIYLVLEIWAEKDPQSAMAALIVQAESGPGDDLFYKIGLFMDSAIQQWSLSSPQKAFDWLIQQEDSSLQNRPKLLESIIEQWALTEPLLALDSAKLFDGALWEQQSIYNAALGVWSRKDATSAAQWFSNHLAGKADEGLSKAAELIGQNLFKQVSGLESLQWVDALPDEESRQNSIASLAFTWAADSEDAQLLDAYYSKVEGDPETYVGHLGEAALQLSISHPDLVTDWINSRENLDSTTDAVIASSVLVLSQSHNQFELAMEWTRQIQDPEERAFSQELLLSSWGSHDAEQLKGWLSENSDSIPPRLQPQP